jgi:hypothetical protein
MARRVPRAERIGLVAVLVALLSLTIPWPAAADVTCTGTLGTQTVDDNVRVPDGASCTLNGTTVKGNVLVGRGASLTATNATIDGNIQDDNKDAGAVQVTASRVDGNIQLEQGTSATVRTTAIDGDLQLESNRGELRADDNTIGGNLQANQNTGGLTITDNTIDGNLQCQANNPAPTGGGNIVRGSAEDQCANLTGTPGEQPPAPDPGTPSRATSRIAGSDRFETAVEISKRVFPQGAPVVYLARSDDYPDALAAKSLTDGPILLVPSCGSLPPVVAAEIRRLDPDRVTALGGTAAVCNDVLRAAASS